MGLERYPSEALDDFGGRWEALEQNLRENSAIKERIDALADELGRVRFEEGHHYVILSPAHRPRFFHVFKGEDGRAEVTRLKVTNAYDLEWEGPASPGDAIAGTFVLPEEPDDVSRRVDRLVSRGGDPDLFAIDHEAS